MSQTEEVDAFLAHYGVKGMRWGIRKNPGVSRRERAKAAANIQARVAEGQARGKRSFEGKLSNEKVVIAKGQKIIRVASREHEDLSSITYASYTPDDIIRYRAIIPDFEGGGAKKRYSAYEHTYEAVKELRSPSAKARLDAFADLMDRPSVVSESGKKITGREYLRDLGFGPEVTSLEKTRLGKALYDGFLIDQYMDTPLNRAYFDSVRKLGYNALVDDNNKGVIADAPLIILDTRGAIKKAGVRQLSNTEINEAQKRFTLPDPDAKA